MEPEKHNYMRKLMKMIEKGELPHTARTANDVDVYHDDWCAVLGGGYCDCDPDIRVRRQPGGVPPHGN
jgi:hypothetical protein